MPRQQAVALPFGPAAPSDHSSSGTRWWPPCPSPKKRVSGALPPRPAGPGPPLPASSCQPPSATPTRPQQHACTRLHASPTAQCSTRSLPRPRPAPAPPSTSLEFPVVNHKRGGQGRPGSHAPMVSRALGACMESGSTQHSSRAQGEILMTSGGSTPMFRHTTSATAVVFSRSCSKAQQHSGGSMSALRRQCERDRFKTQGSPGLPLAPAHPLGQSLAVHWHGSGRTGAGPSLPYPL